MIHAHLLRRACGVVLTAMLCLVTGSARAEQIFGVTRTLTSTLVSFDSATPGNQTTIGNISGLLAGHALRAIDFRPSNGQLYALSSSTTAITEAQLYTVNLATGSLTAVGSGLTLPGNTSVFTLSIDFDPVADAVRVVTSGAQNYRVDPNTGALIARDADINPFYLFSDIAYSNNVVGATSTTLYGYAHGFNLLGTIGSINGTPNSPNGGIFTTIGNTGITPEIDRLGFDISGATGLGYISVDFGGNNDLLYTVNLQTAAVTPVGAFGNGMVDFSVRPIVTVVPEAGTFALMLPVAVTAGALRRRRKA